ALLEHARWAAERLKAVEADNACANKWRDDSVLAAKAHLAKGCFVEADAVLLAIPETLQTDESRRLRNTTRESRTSLEGLRLKIRQQAEAGRFEGLKALVLQALKLQPEAEDLRQWLRSLEESEEKE